MLKTYDHNEVQLIVAGSQMSGFQDGTSITIARNVDAWTFQPNVGGSGTRSKSNNKSGRITFTLSQTSSSNDILSVVALADEVGNAGLVPVMVRDGNGRSIYSAEQAWVVKLPDSEFGAESTGRQWIVETDTLEVFLGGN